MNTNAAQTECPVTFTDQSVKSHFTLFAIFLWVGILLNFFTQRLPLGIVAVVFGCIILYRHWLLLQGHGARTTPEKAVGFCFIPFFNFYWFFIAVVGLAEDNNKYMDEAGVTGSRLSRQLAMAVFILILVTLGAGLLHLPILLAQILSIVLAAAWFFFVMQQRDCILAILEKRKAAPQPGKV
jgi:hypothetical protein